MFDGEMMTVQHGPIIGIGRQRGCGQACRDGDRLRDPGFDFVSSELILLK